MLIFRFDFFLFPANLLGPLIRLVFTDWVLKNSLDPTLKFRFSEVQRKKPGSGLSGSFSSQLQKILTWHVLLISVLKKYSLDKHQFMGREKQIQNYYLVPLNNSWNYSELKSQGKKKKRANFLFLDFLLIISSCSSTDISFAVAKTPLLWLLTLIVSLIKEQICVEVAAVGCNTCLVWVCTGGLVWLKKHNCFWLFFSCISSLIEFLHWCVNFCWQSRRLACWNEREDGVDTTHAVGCWWIFNHDLTKYYCLSGISALL